MQLQSDTVADALAKKLNVSKSELLSRDADRYTEGLAFPSSLYLCFYFSLRSSYSKAAFRGYGWNKCIRAMAVL